MIAKLSWQLVVLVGLILTGIVVLAIEHVDTSVITNVLILLGLGGGGGAILGTLAGLKSNINGNVTELISLLRSALSALAQSPAIPEAKVPDAAPTVPAAAPGTQSAAP